MLCYAQESDFSSLLEVASYLELKCNINFFTKFDSIINYLLSFLDSGLLDHSAEISEIDARLNALQEFMKRSMETAKSTAKR